MFVVSKRLLFRGERLGTSLTAEKSFPRHSKGVPDLLKEGQLGHIPHLQLVLVLRGLGDVEV